MDLMVMSWNIFIHIWKTVRNAAQKMKFSIKYVFSKSDQFWGFHRKSWASYIYAYLNIFSFPFEKRLLTILLMIILYRSPFARSVKLLLEIITAESEKSNNKMIAYPEKIKSIIIQQSNQIIKPNQFHGKQRCRNSLIS